MRWLGSINGHEFEQTPGDSEGHGNLVCCSWITKSWTCLSNKKQKSFQRKAKIKQNRAYCPASDSVLVFILR